MLHAPRHADAVLAAADLERVGPRRLACAASTQARLARLAEQDSVDVQSATQRAVNALVAAVKAGAADGAAGADAAAAALTAWMDKVSGLGQTIGREQGALAKLAAAGRGSASKCVMPSCSPLSRGTLRATRSAVCSTGGASWGVRCADHRAAGSTPRLRARSSA